MRDAKWLIIAIVYDKRTHVYVCVCAYGSSDTYERLQYNLVISMKST